MTAIIRSLVSFVTPSPGLRPPSPKGRGAGGEGAEGRTHAKLIMSSCIVEGAPWNEGPHWIGTWTSVPLREPLSMTRKRIVT